MSYKQIIITGIFLGLVITALFIQKASMSTQTVLEPTFWEFQSIDTMKYSRDTAREKLEDPTFDTIIDRQMKDIAETGATHVGIATPYDEEFIPILKRWVDSARRHNLKIWYRGNFSGWEGWFGYEKIGRAEHMKKTEAFIKKHPELFSEGDVFSPCPECENGGPGDPRRSGDVMGHRKFLIDEHTIAQNAFKQIGKNVDTRYNSMNGDVARLIMDKETTKALGGLVVVDHYVRTPEQLNDDITRFAESSGGKVVLGEFGVPIPDINGSLSEIEQSEWLSQVLPLLASNEHLVGVSYWTNVGGSTQLWDVSGKKRSGVRELEKAYSPKVIHGTVKDVRNRTISDISIIGSQPTVLITEDMFAIPTYDDKVEVEISAPNYKTTQITLKGGIENSIVLQKEKPSFFDKILMFLSNLNITH